MDKSCLNCEFIICEIHEHAEKMIIEMNKKSMIGNADKFRVFLTEIRKECEHRKELTNEQ